MREHVDHRGEQRNRNVDEKDIDHAAATQFA